jgi:hypothetical protein
VPRPSATNATRTPPTQRAPSSPPLSSGEADASGAGGGDEGAAEAPQAQTDPLVSNGLGSPTCTGALADELSATSRRNCETSGFAAAPAPTGDYGIDVHIDSGSLNIDSWGSSITQDMFVSPLWMALVWAVHALVVMLEWCFTIDLLDGAGALGVERGLRQMQSTLTEPWLPLALAVASVLAAYHGIVRRRVADTLGETLLMAAMMIATVWVIVDPTGTVGALGEWANQASLGTLAVAASGSPAAPERALGTSLDTVFVAAIEAPWCYLEFGDVSWCTEPSRLDPRLRATALRIAAQETIEFRCQPGSAVQASCVGDSGTQAKALAHSAELLRDARTNGAIFLALPANSPARNSINEAGSLLRTLCQSSEATNCRGPTAAQAEFRTGGETAWRLVGVLLIVAGLLGMLLLLGFVAVRLLTAAVFSLLYLLLAPAMVLAPAFGEQGRALFRRWAARLLGAVVSKLMFSFLLGVALAILAILANLQALGWWTQWLVMSAFWWGAYAHRHHALGAVEGALSERKSGERARQRSLARRVGDALEGNQLIAAARWAKRKRTKPAPSVERRQTLTRAGHRLARAGADEQATRTLLSEHREASTRAGVAAQITRSLSDKRAQLERVRRARTGALTVGDTRRAAELKHRQDRVGGEIEREQGALNRARQLVSEGEQTQRGGQAHTPQRRDQHNRFLDAQASLPDSVRARHAGERRDYAALSGLAGYGREQYERLDPARRRVARLEIDRELALRRELNETAASFAGGGEARLGRRDRRRVEREFDGSLQRRMRDGGHGMPASRDQRSQLDAWREAGRGERSSVMRDAREVAARRKRQLGGGRP